MKTLEIKVSELIRVFDVVPAIVKFVVRVIQKVSVEVAKFFYSIIIRLRSGRAPPVVKKFVKGKGGSRS